MNLKITIHDEIHEDTGRMMAIIQEHKWREVINEEIGNLSIQSAILNLPNNWRCITRPIKTRLNAYGMERGKGIRCIIPHLGGPIFPQSDDQEQRYFDPK